MAYDKQLNNMNKEDIIKILSQKTEWFDGVQEDLIHEGKFDSIANEIVELFAIPIISDSLCPKCKLDTLTSDGNEIYCTNCGKVLSGQIER